MKNNPAKIYVFKFLTSAHLFAGVLVPFFTDWGGISFQQVMGLQMWFVLCIFLFEVPTGALADHLGRKTSLVLAGLCYAGATFLYAMVPDLKVFIVAETVWALSMALASGADEALLYDSLKALGREKDAPRAIGRLGSMEVAAIAVAAPIGSLMAGAWGLRAPMLATALPGLAAAAVAFSIREPDLAPEEAHTAGPGTQGTPGYRQVLREGVGFFLGHPSLRALAFDSVSIGVLTFMIIWLYQPHLGALGVPLPAFGFVTGVMTGLQVLILQDPARVAGWMGGPRAYLTRSALAASAVCAALAVVEDPWLAAGLVCVLPSLGLPRSAFIAGYMHKHIPSRRRATVMSSVGMARNMMSFLTYPAVGALQAWSPRGTFAVLGALILACAALSRVREGDLLSSESSAGPTPAQED